MPKPTIELMVATDFSDIHWVDWIFDGLTRPPSIAVWQDATCGSGEKHDRCVHLLLTGTRDSLFSSSHFQNLLVLWSWRCVLAAAVIVFLIWLNRRLNVVQATVIALRLQKLQVTKLEDIKLWRGVPYAIIFLIGLVWFVVGGGEQFVRKWGHPHTDVKETVDQGKAYQDKGEYDLAIQNFSEAIRLNPRYADAFYHRGFARWFKGENDLAIQDYSEAIKIDQNHVDALSRRGFVFRNIGNTDRANQDFDRATSINPTGAEGLVSRGRAYLYRGDNDGAIQDNSEAIRLDPNSHEAFTGRGLAYANKRDFDNAIRDYDQAIRINPNYAVAWSDRGLAYANKRDFDNAIRDYNQAIRINPNYPAALNNRGLAYANKHDFDNAIRDYDQAIQINPNYALALSNRGLTYRSKGLSDRAVADFSKALSLNPDQELRSRIEAQLAQTRSVDQSPTRPAAGGDGYNACKTKWLAAGNSEKVASSLCAGGTGQIEASDDVANAPNSGYIPLQRHDQPTTQSQTREARKYQPPLTPQQIAHPSNSYQRYLVALSAYDHDLVMVALGRFQNNNAKQFEFLEKAQQQRDLNR